MYLNNYSKIIVNIGVAVEKGDLIKSKVHYLMKMQLVILH